MDVVLEMAHKHEESSNNNTNNTTPSKDRLIEKVIFNMSDILSINVIDVDLDYAVKGLWIYILYPSYKNKSFALISQ